MVHQHSLDDAFVKKETMLYVSHQILHDGERRLDPWTMTWIPGVPPIEGPAMTEAEGVQWLQKSSGTPFRPPIAVIGPREASGEEYAMAQRLGRRIGELGLTILCGGRQGVMEAVCRGAQESGGLSIGLLPEDDWQYGNPYVSVPIATGIGIARNALIARGAACVIAVGGGLGTISEIALALQFGKKVLGLCAAPAIPGIQNFADFAAMEQTLCRTILNLGLES